MKPQEITQIIRNVSLHEKQSLVDLMFAVQGGYVSCRRASSIIMERVGMPEGYTLIRWGLFRWGWKFDDHFSIETCLTAKGAQKYAHQHAQIMAEDVLNK